MKEQRRPPRKIKSVYRKTRARTSPLTVLIIVMLVIVVLTLSFLLMKDSIVHMFDPDIETAPVTSSEDITDAPEETEPSKAGIDLSSFTSVTLPNTNVGRGSLIVVDRLHPYYFSDDDVFTSLFTNNTSDCFSLSSSSLTLTSDAYKALQNMTSEYYKLTNDRSLMITSAHRTFKEQQEHYDYWVLDSSGNVIEEDAPYFELPGYSDHHTGLAFDVKIYDKAGASFSYSKYCLEKMAWIVEHHKDYGFIMRYPITKGELTGITEEGNHFRYVGCPHSSYIEDNGLCLEEYVELIKSYTLDTELLKCSIGADSYCIYYVPASSGEKTDVTVPSDKEYTVSGNNIDGFIITYKANN